MALFRSFGAPSAFAKGSRSVGGMPASQVSQERFFSSASRKPGPCVAPPRWMPNLLVPGSREATSTDENQLSVLLSEQKQHIVANIEILLTNDHERVCAQFLLSKMKEISRSVLMVQELTSVLSQTSPICVGCHAILNRSATRAHTIIPQNWIWGICEQIFSERLTRSHRDSFCSELMAFVPGSGTAGEHRQCTECEHIQSDQHLILRVLQVCMLLQKVSVPHQDFTQNLNETVFSLFLNQRIGAVHLHEIVTRLNFKQITEETITLKDICVTAVEIYIDFLFSSRVSRQLCLLLKPVMKLCEHDDNIHTLKIEFLKRSLEQIQCELKNANILLPLFRCPEDLWIGDKRTNLQETQQQRSIANATRSMQTAWRIIQEAQEQVRQAEAALLVKKTELVVHEGTHENAKQLKQEVHKAEQELDKNRKVFFNRVASVRCSKYFQFLQSNVPGDVNIMNIVAVSSTLDAAVEPVVESFFNPSEQDLQKILVELGSGLFRINTSSIVKQYEQYRKLAISIGRLDRPRTDIQEKLLIQLQRALTKASFMMENMFQTFVAIQNLRIQVLEQEIEKDLLMWLFHQLIQETERINQKNLDLKKLCHEIDNSLSAYSEMVVS